MNAYLKAHPGPFRIEPRFTFRQIFLNPAKHGGNLAQDAAKLLAQLNQAGDKVDLANLGDPFLLDDNFTAVAASDVAKQFGEKFASALRNDARPFGRGPVESGYGAHLVFVSERTEGGAPALANVRAAVRREWENARRLEANEKFYQDLLKHYTVTIEAMAPVAEPRKLVEAK